MELGQWLARQRESLDWTQRRLARESKVTQSTISDIEAGKQRVTNRTMAAVRQLCDTLGVSLLEAYDRAGLLDFTDEADRDAIEAALLIVRLGLSSSERAELLQVLKEKE